MGAQTIFTDLEAKFLAHHNISLHDVFDARGLRAPMATSSTRSEGRDWILYNACRKGGHPLFTRNRHCIQCDSSKIAFQRRDRRTGWVYVLESVGAKLIKVGGTESLEERIRSVQGYGGARDWALREAKNVRNYGELERRVQSLLERYAIAPIPYTKNDRIQLAYELFKCEAKVAVDALERATKN